MSISSELPPEEVDHRCPLCKAYLDEEDLFCGNCGSEAPKKVIDAELAGSEVAPHSFQCGGCGASMSYSAKAKALRCPFCGSEQLSDKSGERRLAAKFVLPFRINESQAKQILKKWLGSSFWRPSDLASTAVITKLSAVFVPYWVFEAEAITYWTADTSHTPPGARGDWYPMFGDRRAQHSGVLVGASSSLTPNETQALCPFDLSQSVARTQFDLEPFIVEQFVVQRKYARPQARVGIEAREQEACRKYVPGRARNIKVNVRLNGLKSTPVLLPIWIMAYRYKGELFRFIINGQSGKHIGTAPTSYWKVALVAGAVIMAGLVVVGCLGIVTGLFA